MSCPLANTPELPRDVLAYGCARCHACLGGYITLAVEIAPDGTIHEWRRPRHGSRDVLLVYEREPDEPWLVELRRGEAAEVFEGAA